MNKIFIRGEEVSEGIIAVHFQHFSPLSETDGLNEEQLKEGYLVDNIPDPTDCPFGKIPRLMYNIEKNELFYEQFLIIYFGNILCHNPSMSRLLFLAFMMN